jgi:hypothetical protein
VRADELREIGDVPLAGQVFNVFRLRDGRIVGIQDYATRREALDAATARDPDWA